jgi:Fe-S-cluster containining protein
MTWLQVGSVAGPTAALPSVAFRSANFRVLGSGQGSVPTTGILAEDEDSKLRFEDFANEEPCPALDPSTGRCDLYEARPTTCRIFGPPIRSGEEGGLGVCDLCFHGASAEEIASCEMQVDPDGLEAKLLADVERSGLHGDTLVAFCLKA